MPRPRSPVIKAAISAADIKNPQRFRNRIAPKAGPLGSPPKWMTEPQKRAWATMASEIPWLDGSHRALLGIAVTVQARLESGEEVGIQALNLLRQCLGQMGATPADATKVSVPDGESQDPDEQFFGRPN